MLQNNAKADSVQIDIIAIDALFKRIAERGRKVRAQEQSQVMVGETKDPEPEIKEMTQNKEE